MPVFRLDSVAPSIAERFRQASPSKRRQAALVACERAAASAHLSGQRFGRALDALRGMIGPDPHLRGLLEDAAAEFDNEYFRLNEEGDGTRQQEALMLFSKARAASALVFALSGDDAQLHEAIYEAITAIDDPGDIVRLVEEALR